MTGLLCAFLLAAAAPAAAQAPAPPEPAASTAAASLPLLDVSTTTLTLDRCVRIALAQATEVLKAGYGMRTAGVAVLESYGRFLPNLSAGAVASRVWGRVFLTVSTPTLEDTINYGLAYQVATDLNLFNGLSDYNALKSAAERDRASRQSLRRARQAVALDVAQTYLQVALDQQLVTIEESSLRLSLEREAYLEEQARVGAKSVVDLYQQQAAARLAESAAIAARARARDDLLTLLAKLRLDVSREWAVAGVSLSSGTAASPGEEASLLGYALAHRSDVESARALSTAAGRDVLSARAGYYPTLDLSLGAASAARRYQKEVINGVDLEPPVQDPIGEQLANHGNWTLALSLNWFVFDRFATRLSVARARERADGASLDYQDAVTRAQSEVRQAWTDYRAAQAQVSSSAARLEAAQKAFEAMRGRYDVQAASFLDLITAQDVLTQAQAARAQALIGLELQGRALRYALGDDPF